ncbi:SAM-dependent methyltransferase [Nocardia sp. NPDC058518]|uniref:SAM-dependent methyltransferase n=1 Tax=Nocardia sp. NPDC058518 TaxID=3346534 RepID=UPI00364608B7
MLRNRVRHRCQTRQEPALTTTDPSALIDPYRTTPARLHNAILGGKDHYTADHALATTLATNAITPAITESHRFTLRAVEYLIDRHGVSQFVDIGCGYPHAPNIHDIAERRSGTTRTLYIDNDPVVATYGRALLTGPNRFFTDTDVTDTATVLADITAVMDTARPIAVCVSGTAELIGDAPAVVAALTDRLPAGTWMVFTHITDEVYGDEIHSAVRTLRGAGINYHARGREEIAAMLTGYRFVTPGLVAPHRWPLVPSDGDGVRALFAMPRHRAAWDLSAYAAVGQLHR